MLAEPNRPVLVLVLAFLAWLSDGVDGYIAKTYGWSTKLGARLDQYADWSFGVALLYTIFVAEDFTLTWYNTPLMFLIGLYLLLRMRYLATETTEVAKLKTFVQFLGGIVILSGHAFVSSVLLVIGYLIVASSLPLMYRSLRSYRYQGK
jgi:cardiolipin synthase